jgi:hypothetical protein
MTDYTNTDQRIHLLSQLIAKVNRTFVPKKEDDSHTNLYFDSIGKRIYGRWFEANTERLVFSLHLTTLHFELLNDQLEVLSSVLAIGKTIAEIEETVEKEVTQLGISAAGLKLPLHFEIPQYKFTSHPIQPIDQQKLIEWCGYRSIANQVCNDLLGLAQTPGEIRIWPHHFDTGIYFEPNKKIGIGFGFAMEDSMVGAPYLYISGYPKDRTIIYQNAPTSENWQWEISENWKGCVLPLPKLKDLAENDRNTVIADYLSATYHWFLNQ